jgi:hypothetical protein
VVATVVAGVTFFIPDGAGAAPRREGPQAVVVADGYEPRAFENGMTIASNLADIVQMDPVELRKR